MKKTQMFDDFKIIPIFGAVYNRYSHERIFAEYDIHSAFCR
jgi:hypothetical protein